MKSDELLDAKSVELWVCYLAKTDWWLAALKVVIAAELKDAAVAEKKADEMEKSVFGVWVITLAGEKVFEMAVDWAVEKVAWKECESAGV